MKESPAEKPEATNTLNRILMNALEHFSNFGYAGASVREITHAAHVTKPTLYYYFKNKEELYRGLVRSCSDKIFTALTDSVKQEGDLKSKFMKLVKAQNGLCDEDLPAVKFIFLTSFSPARNLPDVGISEFNNRIREIVERLTEDAVRKGEVTAEKRACVGLMLHGLLAVSITSRLAGVPFAIESVEKAIDCMINMQ
jgi:AcrR family transcriptional regulator